MMEDGTLTLEPELILERRLKKKGRKVRVDLLVKWKGTPRKTLYGWTPTSYNKHIHSSSTSCSKVGGYVMC
jgi:hypothetical protein